VKYLCAFVGSECKTKTLVPVYQPTMYNVIEERNLQSDRRENPNHTLGDHSDT